LLILSEWASRNARTEDVLRAGGADDDLGAHGGDPDLDAGEAVLPELAGQHLVQLRQENAIRDELRASNGASTQHAMEIELGIKIREGSGSYLPLLADLLSHAGEPRYTPASEAAGEDKP
jgi:hypothetical protein